MKNNYDGMVKHIDELIEESSRMQKYCEDVITKYCSQVFKENFEEIRPNINEEINIQIKKQLNKLLV